MPRFPYALAALLGCSSSQGVVDGEVAANGARNPDSAEPVAADAGDSSTDPAPSMTYATLRDLAYATQDPAQRLDLFLPDGAGPFPVVVWIHGGGWAGGDKRPCEAEREAARGYAVASINYRLSRTARFPAQIYDVKAAIRWLRAHATEYRLDPAHVGAWGSSAGGHLAALAGTSGKVAALEDLALGNSASSSDLQAVVDFYGPTDFLQMDANVPASCPKPLVHNSANSPESLLIGCQIQTCSEAVERANPISYVSKSNPPFFVAHGTADCTVPPQQSEILRHALERAGVPVTLRLISGATHGDAAFDAAENSTLVDAFLDTYLRVTK